MDYAKLDAGLAAALGDVADEESRALNIFIHAKRPPQPDEARCLENTGLGSNALQQEVFTATVSPKVVDELSQQTWVKSLRLSRVLRPIETPRAR